MKSELHQQLELLHAELSKTQSLDAESRQLLLVLLADITRLLDPEQDSAKENEPLADHLEELAVRFEAEHPALGTALRGVVDALAKAGI